MYIDTGTFWTISIGLGVAIGIVYYMLKQKIEKKADFDSEIYFLAGVLFKTCQILIDHSDKKAQEEVEVLFAQNEQRFNHALENLDKQLKKQQEKE